MSHDLIARFSARYREFVRDAYSDGEIVPWWKGYVTELYATRRTKVAPLGFNVLFYTVYSFWLFVRSGPIKFDLFRRDQEQLRRRRGL